MKTTALATSLFVLGTALAGTFQTAQAQDASDLHGGWIVTSWTSADGEVNDEPQRGLFIFAPTMQYSMMYEGGDEPRADLTPESTDAEELAVYRAFTANSGRYSVDGDHLTYEAYMAKWPNYMHAFMTDEGNGTTVQWSVDDGILTLTWEDGRSATFRRPGGNG